MRVCLINPAIYIFEKDIVPLVPPMGLLCLGAVLYEKGYEVEIIDSPMECSKKRRDAKVMNGTKLIRYGYTPDQLKRRLLDLKPDIVGITNNMSANESEALECAEVVKSVSKSIYVVMGGVNVTARLYQILSNKYVDFVIAGEGDDVLPELIKSLEMGLDISDILCLGYKKNQQINLPKEIAFVSNIDKLPMPAWYLIDLNNYLKLRFPFTHLYRRTITLLTSRGCVYNCVFCSGRNLLGKWRARSPEKVHEEISYLKEKYGIREIQFMDANINVNTNRFIEICKILKNENLAWNPVGGLFIKALNENVVRMMIDSGCYYLPLAVEHGSSEMQKYIGKIIPIDKVKDITRVCKQHGVWTHSFFIIGFPEETKEEAFKCLDYAKESGVDSISIFTATPLPGSKLFSEVSSYLNINVEDLRLLSNNFVAKKMKKEDVILCRKIIMISFLKHKIISELLHPLNLFKKLTRNNFRFSRIFLQSFKRFILLQLK